LAKIQDVVSGKFNEIAADPSFSAAGRQTHDDPTFAHQRIIRDDDGNFDARQSPNWGHRLPNIAPHR
jgi:hypothetical protein